MRSQFAFGVGLITALSFGWLVFPHVLYRTEAQPLQFSHKAHKDKAGLECSGCHELTTAGQFTGIPKLENCAGCHAEAMGTTPAEAQLVRDYVKPEREVPWKVYARQPLNARFSHAIHVQQAKLKCAECHGARGESATAEPFYRNRISGESRNVWGPRMLRVGLKSGEGMKMSDCEDCHAQHGVTASCLGCHR